MSALTIPRAATSARRRPRVVAFLLADDERRPDYIGAASIHRHDDGSLEHETVGGPVLPVPVIIAARIGLLALGVVATIALVLAAATAITTIGA